MTPMPLRACALALVLLVSACGADDGATTAAPPGGQDPTPAATPDPAAATAEAIETSDGNRTEGCVGDHTPGTDHFPDQVEFTEAEGVRVTYAEAHKVVEVDLPGGEPVRTVLVQCGTPAPDLTGDLAGATVVEVPVASLVTLTTTNLPHLDLLGAVDRLEGVGTGAFVTTPAIVEHIEGEDVPDFADAAGQPDVERLLGAVPDLLLVDGFGETVLDDVARLTEAGIPTAVNVDFEETTLLGRAEWIKYTALFLNAEAAAEEAFEEIAAAYRDIAEQAADAEQRPTVFANTPFEGTWYTPGGGSFIASAIADAGGEYVFADDDSTGSLALDIETVLDRAAGADVWLQAGSVDGTLDDLLAQDPRFAEFRAFQEGEVWAQDAFTNEQGGNAVYELAYTRADLFLADLFAILHPDEGGDHDLVFFGQVPGGEQAR